MIRKRLLQTMGGAKKYIAGNVALQWCGLLCSIAVMLTISAFIQALYLRETDAAGIAAAAAVIGVCVLVRFVCTAQSARLGFLSAKTVKQTLRGAIYRKLLRLGLSYRDTVPSAEVVQIATEGVDQLESYFSAYLPQLVYSLLAPLTLFATLSFISLPAALVLLVCVPLIPLTIAAVQTVAKKMLSRYWNRYASLGDTFLENLQGLTTLKIYQADEYKNEEMNRESEAFRKITMKVLFMQLQSITLMDLIAYGGAALGITVAVLQYRAGAVSLSGCLAIVLLSAEFFIPMRMLGSYFHMAMNGMAASDKIFRLLDAPEKRRGAEADCPRTGTIRCRNLGYAYSGSGEALRGINADFPPEGMTAIVGKSGSGKSTLARILAGRLEGYTGEASVGGTELYDINKEGLRRHITYVGFDSYLFKGTVRDNLRMGDPAAEDAALWNALARAELAEFLKTQDGLETAVAERGANLSGGQRQRLSLARAILRNSPVYIFDEVTSSIDIESEQAILRQIRRLAVEKTVIMITHRLANTKDADCIYVLLGGSVAQRGTHAELLRAGGPYAALWETQSALERYGKEAAQ